MYDNEMELMYTDDAMTFDVEVIITNPETGETRSVVVDNLTSAMYFMVNNELCPIREGYDDKIPNLTNDELPEEIKEIHEGFRDLTLHTFMLKITCEGDPDLLDQFGV